MIKKRNVFDIDFELEGGDPPAERAIEPARRGPMASAIAETSKATAERFGAEEAIRAENDALAHEHVRLKKLGLITDLIATVDIRADKLTRDRSTGLDPELAELKESIKAVGLSNPIRVEQTADGYELIQGFRRLSAFRELAAETGDNRYTRIPAALVPRGEPLVSLYRKMVDENMVRKDLSFGEMAQLAVAYASDEGISSGEAVAALYASALKQKRSYIRQFARVIEALGPTLRFPEVLPRALGLNLAWALDTGQGAAITAALDAQPERDAATEQSILKKVIARTPEPARKKPAKSVSKTTIRIDSSNGEAKVTAVDGRLELRYARDFSAISKARLQRSIEALLRALDGD